MRILTNVAWWTLTPDNFGSYIDGTWTEVASPGPCPNGKISTSYDLLATLLCIRSAP